MNGATGIFTAPVRGRYFFAFSSYTSVKSNSWIKMKLNGVHVGTTSTDSQWTTSAMQMTLDLKRGDLVTLILDNGSIHDDSNHYTHFTGLLVDQDIFN